MENRKTISYLNSWWWYRLMKVIYLAFLFLSLVGYPIAVFLSLSPEYDNDKSYIQCANGKTFVLSQNEINLYSDYLGYSDAERVKGLCFDGTLDFVKDKYGQTQLQVTSKTDNSGKYELVSKYKDRNWFASIGFALLSILATLAFFEVARRIFYYIFLGSIKPEK